MTDPSQAELPYVKFAIDTLKAKGIDPKSSGNLNGGEFFAWPMVQALILAGQFEGGLTRTNFVMAQRMMVMTHPYVYEGINWTTNGAKDAYPIEGGVYQQYNVAKQAFERRSDIINLDGKSTPCAWGPVDEQLAGSDTPQAGQPGTPSSSSTPQLLRKPDTTR